jgi:capsular exopolysaccharide synthesis family protein
MSMLNNKSSKHTGTHIPAPFRHLRINIDFMQAKEERIQTIAVTSSKRGEGRTTTAKYLAMAYAQSGKSTILVHADWSSESTGAHLSGSAASDLHEYLDHRCSLQDVIGVTSIGNLDVVRSSQATPNGLELLTSPRMEQFLSELKRMYDIVIIDCAPLGSIDGKVLSVQSDGAVLVMEYGKVSRDTAHKVNEELKQLQIKLLGTVLNKCKDAKALMA